MSDSSSASSTAASVSSASNGGRHQRSLKFWGAGLLLGLLALAVSNPNKPSYVNYAAERLPKTLKQECKTLKQEVDVVDVVRLPTRDICHTFVHSADLVGRGLAKQVIEVSTERRNFGVISLYETKVPGRRFTTLGIARQFFLLHGR